MKILITTSWFNQKIDDPTLVNDLAQELTRQGHDVLVYAQDWFYGTQDRRKFSHHDVRILWQPAAKAPWFLKPFSTPIKWCFTSWLGWSAYKNELKDFDADAVISFAPAVIYNRIINKLIRSLNGRKLVIQWDFFPIHHARIGLIKGKTLETIAMKWECFLLGLFDVVGHMSEKNIEFFEQNFKIEKSLKQEILPIWGNPAEQTPDENNGSVRETYGLPTDKILAVFGGQLSAGRGLENLIERIRQAAEIIPECHFVIIGDGKLRPWIENEITSLGLKNLTLLRRVSRSEYQSLVRSCDIGLVSTQGGTGVPTFPSKSIDYSRNKLPILASVEDTTDFGIQLQSAGAGLFVEAEDTDAFWEALKKLCRNDELRISMGDASYEYFLKTHLASNVVKKIISVLQ